MDLIPLLGRKLKEPSVIELLDHYDIRVLYDFDRHFENQPDAYWAESEENGFIFRFDENQFLTTIFVYTQPTRNFNRCSLEPFDFELFDDFDAVRSFVDRNELRHSLNADNPNVPQWLRIEFESYFVHYQFNDSGLSQVTLMLPRTAPGSA